MEKTTQSTAAINAKFNESAALPAGWFSRQAQKFEESRFGWMAMLITIQTCLGSIACMYVQQSGGDVFMLAAGMAVTMGANAVMIAQGSGKLCLFMFYLSVALNTALIILNLARI